MAHNYKYVSIYMDSKGTLLGIPSGKSKKYGMADLNLLFMLAPPYSDAEIETFILNLFDKCFTQLCEDDGISSIERHYNCKGYLKATKQLRLVHISWLKEKGYTVTPTKNAQKDGFKHIEAMSEKLETDFTRGNMSLAFLRAMEIAT